MKRPTLILSLLLLLGLPNLACGLLGSAEPEVTALPTEASATAEEPTG